MEFDWLQAGASAVSGVVGGAGFVLWVLKSRYRHELDKRLEERKAELDERASRLRAGLDQEAIRLTAGLQQETHAENLVATRMDARTSHAIEVIYGNLLRLSFCPGSLRAHTNFELLRERPSVPRLVEELGKASKCRSECLDAILEQAIYFTQDELGTLIDVHSSISACVDVFHRAFADALNAVGENNPDQARRCLGSVLERLDGGDLPDRVGEMHAIRELFRSRLRTLRLRD